MWPGHMWGIKINPRWEAMMRGVWIVNIKCFKLQECENNPHESLCCGRGGWGKRNNGESLWVWILLQFAPDSKKKKHSGKDKNTYSQASQGTSSRRLPCKLCSRRGLNWDFALSPTCVCRSLLSQKVSAGQILQAKALCNPTGYSSFAWSWWTKYCSSE